MFYGLLSGVAGIWHFMSSYWCMHWVALHNVLHHTVQKKSDEDEKKPRKTKQQMSLLQRMSVFLGTNTTQFIANETNTQCSIRRKWLFSQVLKFVGSIPPLVKMKIKSTVGCLSQIWWPWWSINNWDNPRRLSKVVFSLIDRQICVCRFVHNTACEALSANNTLPAKKSHHVVFKCLSRLVNIARIANAVQVTIWLFDDRCYIHLRRSCFLLHPLLITASTFACTWSSCLRRGVRSDAQLSCTHTRFQKCC